MKKDARETEKRIFPARQQFISATSHPHRPPEKADMPFALSGAARPTTTRTNDIEDERDRDPMHRELCRASMPSTYSAPEFIAEATSTHYMRRPVLEDL